MSRSWNLTCLAAAMTLGLAGPARADENPRADWPVYGGSFGQQRFSRLSQVSTKNVAKLRVAWTYAIPDAGMDDASLQVTPLVVRGRDAGLPAVDALMLVTSPLGRVIALDGANGQPLWEFAPPLREPLKLCCSKSNRGAAFGRVRTGFATTEPRVYVATLDARLWALSASTGQPVASFGDGGGPAGSLAVGDNNAGYSLTMAPLFIPRGDIPAGGGPAHGHDLVVIGSSGADYAIRGSVTAYDALTGEMVWRFFTVPSPGEFGGDTWPVLQGKFADPHLHGGGGVWMTPAYDSAAGRLFIAVGNPAPTLDGTHRAGNNLFTGSIVALDVRTGTRVWHFQQVHHDIWDYDSSSPPLLFEAAGRPAVGEAGKTGFFYILDRDTGVPIHPCPETPVPPSDVVAPDGTAESASPTQPVCDPGLQFVPMLRPGETPLDSPAAATIQPIFTPPAKGGTKVQPAVFGGAEWSPVASNPDLGLAFIPALVQPATYFVLPQRKPSPGKFSFGGLPIPELVHVTGTLTAIDVNAGAIRWQNHTVRPLVGGALTTAGGLLFYGEGTPLGGAFVALEAATGTELFRFKTHGGVNAAPMTYLANGKQMVAVAAGGHLHFLSRPDNLLIAFGLR